MISLSPNCSHLNCYIQTTLPLLLLYPGEWASPKLFSIRRKWGGCNISASTMTMTVSCDFKSYWLILAFISYIAASVTLSTPVKLHHIFSCSTSLINGIWIPLIDESHTNFMVSDYYIMWYANTPFCCITYHILVPWYHIFWNLDTTYSWISIPHIPKSRYQKPVSRYHISTNLRYHKYVQDTQKGKFTIPK